MIPLRLDADAELPFRLGARQYVDFSGDFDSGLARLRQHLAWTGTPEGFLTELRQRLADAKRELPRARQERQPQIEAEITELKRRIQEQQRLIDDPDAEQLQTVQRIEADLEQERKHARRVPATLPRTRFINPPPVTAPRHFQDRHGETELSQPSATGTL